MKLIDLKLYDRHSQNYLMVIPPNIMGIIKNCLEWIGLKKKLHAADNNPPFFKEGDIWWCYIGENIGIETNGKGEQFTRPIFVYKKYDKYSFLGLPLTTKQKNGTWYVPIDFHDKSQTVILSQGRAFDYRRFKEKMGQLDEKDVLKIKQAYSRLHARSDHRPLAIAGKARG